MATWIMHLRLAELLLEEIDGLDASSFAIGSIAPDSGIPDEKWEKFTPPPQVTHFLVAEDSRYRSADLDFYRRYLQEKTSTDVGEQPYSFLMGYFFHLITDNLHNEMIGTPTLQRWIGEFAADSGFIWEVKKDWYGQDFIYLRDHPDCLFWKVFLGCRSTESYLDFLPADAIRQRVEYIQQYYQRTDAEIQELYARPFIYLPKEHFDRFIEDSAQRMRSIYRRLWKDGVAPGNFRSALEIK
jgi:hypothetical protein